MHRRVEITKLPIEIHLAIIQSVLEDPPEIEMPGIPEETYLNKFTRPAKTLRRVCQRWKALVDHPLTYSSRITTAVLEPDYDADEGYSSDALETFRSHLQLSNSFLVVRLGFYPPMFPVKEIRCLFPYGDRLIKIEALFQKLSFTSHLMSLLGSFRGLPRLFDLTVQDVDEIYFGSNDDTRFNVGLSEATETNPPAGTFSEICQQLSSVRKLDIFSWELEDAIYMPSDLTSLGLHINIFCFHTFPPSLSTSLRELKLQVHSGWCTECDKSIFSLDALESLEIVADSQDLIDMLCRLKCARLEHAALILGNVTGEVLPETYSTPTSTPSLRTLCVERFPLSLLWIVEALNVPEFFERLTVFSRVYESRCLEYTPDNRLGTFKKIKSHTLDISHLTSDCSHFLELYPGISTVQQLHVILHDDDTYMGDRGPHFEAPFPKLQSLTLAGGYISVTRMITNRTICTSGELHTLAFGLPTYLSPRIGQRHWDRWCDFAFDAASRDTYSSVTTLIVPWRSASLQFLSGLFRMTPNIRTLVVTVENYDDWTKEANSLSEHFHLLESVIVEGRDTSRWTIDDLENARPHTEAAIPSIIARCDETGARPSKLQRVILRSFSEWDVVEVRNYPQECGVLLQPETAIDDGDRGIFNRDLARFL
jgi:hypothetical protein